MINYYLPDFYNNAALICFLADLREHMSGWFYDDVKIASAYGSFPNCIWNGGRVFLDKITKQQMRTTIDELNKRGVAVRYTFTNPLIEEKHLNDTLCNLCLEMADNGMNEVLVNSQVLEDYIRANYPGFKLISSTTKCLDKATLIEEELKKDYFLVVMDSAMNNTEELFGLSQKEKIELIVNHYCADNCPKRRAHYNAVGKAQLEYSELEFPECQNIGKEFFQIAEKKNFISTDMIFGKYKDAGFQHFKLDGRGFSPHRVVESFVYYLVKPQFRDMVRQIILKEVYHF